MTINLIKDKKHFKFESVWHNWYCPKFKRIGEKKEKVGKSGVKEQRCLSTISTEDEGRLKRKSGNRKRKEVDGRGVL